MLPFHFFVRRRTTKNNVCHLFKMCIFLTFHWYIFFYILSLENGLEMRTLVILCRFRNESIISRWPAKVWANKNHHWPTMVMATVQQLKQQLAIIISWQQITRKSRHSISHNIHWLAIQMECHIIFWINTANQHKIQTITKATSYSQRIIPTGFTTIAI